MITPEEAYYLITYNPLEFKRNKDYYEKIIATDADYSYDYAYYILEDRFQLGEKIIATQAGYSYLYAKYILKDRFELGEYMINKDCITYYTKLIKNKTPFYYKFI